MNKLPRVTAKKLIIALKRAGWREGRQVGSHLTLWHQDKPSIVVVPIHSGDTIGPKLLSSIMKQASLTPDELRELL